MKIAERIARNHAFHDRLLQEKALTEESTQKISETIKNLHPSRFIHQYIINFFEAGDIIEDNKGRGTLQKMILTARGYEMPDLTPM